MPKKFDFTVSQFLSTQGMQILGGTGDALDVEDAQGNQFTFSPQEYLSSQGVQAEDVDIQINTPKEAIPESPLGVLERGKLAFGNVKGNVNYLKQQYEDVRVDEDKGIVVKDNGMWKTVDPTNIRFFAGEGQTTDPWNLSEALADVVEGVAGEGLQIGGAVGGAIGAAGTTLGLGTALGAAGGAAGGEFARTSIGRYFGTYNDTVIGQLEDIGQEALLAFGGEIGAKALLKGAQTVGKAARPRIDNFVRSMKKIDKAPAESKSMLASVYGNLTGAGADYTRVGFQAPDQVFRHVNRIDRALGKTVSTETVDNFIAEGQSELLSNLVKKATFKEQALYRQGLNELVRESGKGGVFVADIPKMVDNVFGEWVEKGYGSLAKDGSFVVPSLKEAGKFGTKEARVAIPAIRNKLNNVVKFMNGARKAAPGLSNKEAVEQLVNVERFLNEATKGVFTDPNVLAVKRFASDMSAGWHNQMTGSFKSAGLSGLYERAMLPYKQINGSLKNLRKLLGNPARGVPPNPTKIRRLFASPFGRGVDASRIVPQGDLGVVAGLLGKPAQTAYQEMVYMEAARRFAPWATQRGILKGVALAGVGQFVTGVGLPVAGLATQTMPRAVLHQARIAQRLAQSGLGQKLGGNLMEVRRGSQAAVGALGKQLHNLLDHVKSMGPKGADWLLNHPNELRSMLQVALQAGIQEEQEVEKLLQQGGILGQ
jgi:hypothetical protein